MDSSAREKTFFNVTIKTDFDQTIGKIDMVAQDIGRVLLNLYNNAFGGVCCVRKEKTTSGELRTHGFREYTKKLQDKIEIIVQG